MLALVGVIDAGLGDHRGCDFFQHARGRGERGERRCADRIRTYDRADPRERARGLKARQARQHVGFGEAERRADFGEGRRRNRKIALPSVDQGAVGGVEQHVRPQACGRAT